MYESRVTLTRDEEFSGTVTMSDSYLDCNGYEFRTSNGGNLEQTDGLVNLDHGTLYVDGEYVLHCSSVSVRTERATYLCLKGGTYTD